MCPSNRVIENQMHVMNIFKYCRTLICGGYFYWALLAVKTTRGPWIAHLNPGTRGGDYWPVVKEISFKKVLFLALVAMLLSRAECS